jgi:hypothetical protein
MYIGLEIRMVYGSYVPVHFRLLLVSTARRNFLVTLYTDILLRKARSLQLARLVVRVSSISTTDFT